VVGTALGGRSLVTTIETLVAMLVALHLAILVVTVDAISGETSRATLCVARLVGVLADVLKLLTVVQGTSKKRALQQEGVTVGTETVSRRSEGEIGTAAGTGEEIATRTGAGKRETARTGIERHETGAGRMTARVVGPLTERGEVGRGAATAGSIVTAVGGKGVFQWVVVAVIEFK
jgi:hypothetical protein